MNIVGRFFDYHLAFFKSCHLIRFCFSLSGQLDYISIDSRENRLLFFSTEADLDETLVIRKPLLKS